MDPLKPESFNHRTEYLSTGRTYHFVDQSPSGLDPAKVPTILCVHGFPDLWYGWRYQMKPWVQAGYRVVVPSMLGYCGTDKPAEPAQYSLKKLSADLAALLDLLGVTKVILIGHDWGAGIVWRFSLYHPERLLALVVLSIPFVPPAPAYIPLDKLVEYIPDFGYQVYFNEDRSAKEIETHIEDFMRLLHRRPGSGISITKVGEMESFLKKDRGQKSALFGKMKPTLSEQELQYYVSEYAKGGLEGPLSYYKTSQVRYEEERDAKLPPKLPATLPVLFVYGDLDPTCTPQHLKRSDEFVPNQKKIKLEGIGHWVMVEGTPQVTGGVLAFLDEILGKRSDV